MFYTFNEHSDVISKHIEQPEGDNVAYSTEDYDLNLYDVVIGFVSPQGEILNHTKKLKPAEVVEARILTIENRQAESELDTDFRLSMLELGLV
ncbi:MAG: hypothetical protein K0S61_4487 [Anaerocolumna sp.]|jgi:hypothetical protein|nr:hypothetical protein [Anaerocolumna sp.]